MTKKKKTNPSRVQTSAAQNVPESQETVPEIPKCKNDGLKELELEAVESLKTALATVRELARERLAAKQSVSRLTGVARELKELVKVMSVYGC